MDFTSVERAILVNSLHSFIGVRDGLSPMFYHTLCYEGDLELESAAISLLDKFNLPMPKDIQNIKEG